MTNLLVPGIGIRSLRYSLLPMQQAVKTQETNRLTLAGLVDWMVADKLVDAETAAKFKKERRYYRGVHHPLVIIGEQKWKKGAELLTLEYLTEWLAKRVGMEYFHIDPLKIDLAAVTEMMSSAYATRFRILPVGLTAKEAVVATAEPNVRDWEPELARMIKRDIKRVIANPLDISATRSSSTTSPSRSRARTAPPPAQPPACRASSSSSSCARRTTSTRTTRTSSRWSTGCGSTLSSSARATSTSSRAASRASCASGSTACCTRCTRSRWRCSRR